MTSLNVQVYLNQIEETTTCTVATFTDADGIYYQLFDACGDLIAQFDSFEEMQLYTVETVERVEASRGIA